MSDQDVFNTNIDTTPKAPEDLLASIKNENGEQKYKTIEEAIKALEHSQAFIKTLQTEKSSVETEIQTLREEVKKINNVDEVLRKLTADNEQKRKEETPPASGLSEEAVAKIIEEKLKAKEFETVATKNILSVNEALKVKFGGEDKAREQVNKKAQELGMSPSQMKELAASSPAAVLALFGGSPSVVTPTTSSVRLPGNPTVSDVVAPPAKSVLLGASSNEQKEHFLAHKAAVYKRLGIEG